MKRKSDIWKCKYKKISKEMKEVQEQFQEYTKIIVSLKEL